MRIDKKAFTLIELVMVIVILGILAAVVAPAFVASYDESKIDAAAKKMMQDIKYAQQLAVARQVAHGVNFNTSTEAYSIYKENTTDIVKNPATQKPFTVSYASGELNGIDILTASFTNPSGRVEFDSAGAPSSAGTIMLSYKGHIRTIRVLAGTGKIAEGLPGPPMPL